MKRKENKLEFIRWGGLSPVKQKGRFVPDKLLNSGEEVPGMGFFGTFHRPPARKGIYAFVPGYIEMFLVSWKIYTQDEEGNYTLKKEFEHARRFQYSGKLWTHIFVVHPEVTYYKHRDSWHETDTDSFEKLLKIHKWELNKETASDDFLGPIKNFSDFSRAWKIFDKDHFEVFIERA
jgi:hypothetical protein